MLWVVITIFNFITEYYKQLVLIWVFLNFLFAYKVKRYLKKYYNPFKGETKDKEGNKIEMHNVHEYYPEFRKKDTEISYFQLAFAFSTYMWPRFFSWVALLTFSWIQCKLYYGNRTIMSSTDQETRIKDREFIKNVVRVNFWLGFLFTSIVLDESRADKPEHQAIYRKWLGEEYKMEFESDYSMVLCNHTGIFEIQYLMMKFTPAFIAKVSLQNTPFIGFIADKVETLWLDRKDANSRSQIAESIRKRQEDYINKKIFSPLTIFPEGTTTNGDYVLKLRRGAFESMYPVKSVLFKSTKHDVAEGIIPTHIQMLLDFSRIYNVFKFTELPVIYPTKFMLENYKKIHPEITNEVEIYAEVVREIWSEVGGFTKSDKNFNDYLQYASLVLKKTVSSS